MVFSSLEFLFLFLPVSLLIHFLCPVRWRNTAILAVSLIFYGWGEPIYVFLMVATIVADYLFGFAVSKNADNAKAKKNWLIAAVVFNLLLLGFFKYADFIIENLSAIPIFSGLSPIGIRLPIGISFYTFQALSYVIDVYRGEANVQKNIASFGAYITLFPQLIAGPIVRYHDIDLQLSSRSITVDRVAQGFRRFICGLAKKVLLANSAYAMWSYYTAMPDGTRTVVGAWLGIAWFSAYIYFDFSGYSDMAIGLGKVLGFDFAENFNYPYISKSITDFWRRWHISLSTWFREYVYIPLGGNRCSSKRMFFNLFVTWLLTGIWHGASWNYVVWGLYFFALLVIEKAFLGKLLKKLPSFLSHSYALFFIAIGWLIFAFEDSSAGLSYLGSMFGVGASAFVDAGDGYEIVRSFATAAIMCFAAVPQTKAMLSAFFRRRSFGIYAENAVCVALLLICTAFLVDSTFNPFLYFRF